MKIVDSKKPLTIFAKTLHHRSFTGTKYVSANYKNVCHLSRYCLANKQTFVIICSFLKVELCFSRFEII